MKVARHAIELASLRNKYQARKDQSINRMNALLDAGHDAGNPDIVEAKAGIDENEQIQREIELCFETIHHDATKITADLLHQMGYDDWIRLTPDELKRPYNDVDRFAYENFLQGYLTYFEQNENQGHPDLDRKYTLYFDWVHTRTDSALVVYIKPALDKQVYGDYERTEMSTTNGTVLNGQQRSPFPPPPSMTDPIKPPPPPPPTQT